MSRIFGNVGRESSIPDGSLDFFTARQLELLSTFTKVTQGMCKADAGLWAWIKEHNFHITFFNNADFQKIEEKISEIKSMRTVGIANVQESVSNQKGTFSWSRAETKYQLPGKEVVVRQNTVIPTVVAPTRPGTSCLRTFICQFYDIQARKIVQCNTTAIVELAFEHPSCPIKPSGIRAFLKTLEKVALETASYYKAIESTPTVTGIQFYNFVGHFLEAMDIYDYYTLQEIFITTVLRGFRLKKIKNVSKRSTLLWELECTNGFPESVLVMTKAVAKSLGSEFLYKTYVDTNNAEPMVFIGGMNPCINIPDEVTSDVFFPLVQQVSLLVSQSRGLGPVAECMNYLPLQSSTGREASFLLMGYKKALQLGYKKIDIVVSSKTIITLLEAQIGIGDRKSGLLNYVSLAKQAKVELGEVLHGPARDGAFVIRDMTMAVPPPSAKKDSTAYYAAEADRYGEMMPVKGFFKATVFHPSLTKNRTLIAFRYSLGTHGILCTDPQIEGILTELDDLSVVSSWKDWIKANLKGPKRLLLSSVCPDLFGSQVGNHLRYDKIVATLKPGTIDDYVYENREEIDWNDVSDEDDLRSCESDEDESVEEGQKKAKYQQQQQHETSSEESEDEVALVKVPKVVPEVVEGDSKEEKTVKKKKKSRRQVVEESEESEDDIPKKKRKDKKVEESDDSGDEAPKKKKGVPAADVTKAWLSY